MNELQKEPQLNEEIVPEQAPPQRDGNHPRITIKEKRRTYFGEIDYDTGEILTIEGKPVEIEIPDKEPVEGKDKLNSQESKLLTDDEDAIA